MFYTNQILHSHKLFQNMLNLAPTTIGFVRPLDRVNPYLIKN